VVHFGFVDEGFGPTKAAPWRAGANETTTISFSHDVKVDGKPMKAGTYGLFLDVEKEGPWQWIFSTNNDGWGSYQYDPKEDVLRVSVTPMAAPHTEFLTYGFDDRKPDSTVAYLQWEDKRIPFRIEVPNANEIYVAQIRHNLLSWPGFDYKNWQNAAQFCAANKVNLDEALVWADKAIHGPFRGATIGSEDFSTVQTKADVLQAMGKTDEADKLMDHAFQLTGADLLPVHIYGMRLLGAGRKEKAIEVFKLNQKRHPEDKFWANLGLARAYTATGDKAQAIKSWEIVLQNIPADRKGQLPAYQAALKKLKGES
jgi:tetratricopeptide (TPR) repeat protein